MMRNEKELIVDIYRNKRMSYVTSEIHSTVEYNDEKVSGENATNWTKKIILVQESPEIWTGCSADVNCFSHGNRQKRLYRILTKLATG